MRQAVEPKLFKGKVDVEASDIRLEQAPLILEGESKENDPVNV